MTVFPANDLLVLAQSTPRRGQDAVAESLLWFVALLVIVIAGAIVVVWIRRRLRAADESPAALGLTLEELRRQRDEGRLTVAEYESLKEVVIRETQGAGGASEDGLAR